MAISKKRFRVVAVMVVSLAVLGAVGVIVWPVVFGTWHQSPPSQWKQDPDDASVIVVEMMGGDDNPDHVRVDVKETPSSVQLTGWVWDSGKPTPAIGHPVLVRVQLHESLDGRQVVHSDGTPIPSFPS